MVAPIAHLLIRTPLLASRLSDGSVAHWRHSIVRFLHAKPVEYLLTGLLVADVVCVCAEIVIGFYVLHLELSHTEELLAACAISSRRAGGTDTSHAPGTHTWHEIEHVIHTLSIIILFIFAAELLSLVIGLGREFFTSPFYLLDVLIITASLIFDLSGPTDEGGGLFILLRGWRLIRIVHGAWTVQHHEVTHNKAKQKYLSSKMRRVQAAIKKTQDEADPAVVRQELERVLYMLETEDDHDDHHDRNTQVNVDFKGDLLRAPTNIPGTPLGRAPSPYLVQHPVIMSHRLSSPVVMFAQNYVPMQSVSNGKGYII